MAAPGTPTIISPASGARGVDWLAPIMLQKSAFNPGADSGTTATATAYATTVEDTDATVGPTWVNEANLLTNTLEKQSLMASATAAGKSNIVNWTGVSFGVGTSLQVSDVTLRVGGNTDWTSSVGHGHAWTRCQFIWNGRVMQTFDAAGVSGLGDDPEWTGSTTANSVTMTVVNVFSSLQYILGKKVFTVGELEAIGANLRVMVASFSGVAPNVNAWYSGPIKLVVTYYSAPPDRQSSVQWQIATDAGFTSVVYDPGREYHAFDRHVVPAGTLSGNTTYYVRVRQYDNEAVPVASSWSSSASFTTIRTMAAHIAHSTWSAVRLYVDMYCGIPLMAGAWKRYTGSPTSHSVYYARLVRSEQPYANFRIAGFTEDGVSVPYTEVYSIASVEATANTFWFDEADDTGLGYSAVFVRTTDSRSPGAYRGSGVTCTVILGVSNEYCSGGPGDRYDYLGILKGTPAFKESLPELTTETPPAHSASMTLMNPPSETYPGEGLFDRLLGTTRNEASSGFALTGWFSHNQRIVVKAGGNTSAGKVGWDEALPVFDGYYKWDARDLHSSDEVKFTLYSRLAWIKTSQLCVSKYDALGYPRLHASVVGKPIPEVFGTGHRGIPAAVVDTTNRKLHCGRSVSAVTAVYKNRILIPATAWTFSATTSQITITSTTLWDSNASWTYDGSGELYEASATLYPGDFCRMLIEREGVSSTVIDAGDFNSIDSTLWSPSGYHVRAYIDQETPVSDVRSRASKSGLLHCIARPDGRFSACLERPTTLDANSLLLDDVDISLAKPRTFLLTEHLARTVRMTWSQYPKPGIIIGDFSAERWEALAFFGGELETQIDTYHAVIGGMTTVLQATRQDPEEMLSLHLGLLGWLPPLGATVAIRSTGTRVMSRTGDYDWRMYQIRERTFGAEVVLRYIATLSANGTTGDERLL